MALLGAVLLRLENDELRVRQAIRRSGLDGLLGVVASDCLANARDIRRVQAYLRELWDEGQESRWS